MAEVVLDGVTKYFEATKVIAVQDLTLEIPDGSLTVLLGPSGCGKSTILRLIAGLERLTRGKIYIGGVLVNDLSPKERDVAMVFQDYALYPHMDAYNNIAFGLRVRGYSKKEIEKRVSEVAEILGIKTLLHRKPKELSGGERQRVALGRAIVRSPKVFLLDEPLSNLDAKLRVQMRAEIVQLHKRLGATMVYVTHDQTEAMSMGTKIGVIKDGVLQQIDTPEGLYRNPTNKFVASFIGTPSMNFFEIRPIRRDDTVYIKGNIFSIKIERDSSFFLPYLDRKITMGIRPEDIIPSSPGVRVVVDFVEKTGPYTHFYFREGFVMSRDARVSISPGEVIEVSFDINKAFFFDQEGKRII
jgi:multiple sugar transport system ATP-binding protein